METRKRKFTFAGNTLMTEGEGVVQSMGTVADDNEPRIGRGLLLALLNKTYAMGRDDMRRDFADLINNRS